MSEQRELEKWTIFCKSWKRWFVSCYTDRLLANQVAENPVRISCHIKKCKWLNTLDSLVFIWSIYPIKIEVESDENIFSLPDLQKEIPRQVLNF